MHTLFFTLLAFGILITIHELGHFLVAKWCGVKVLRFSLGIGKIIYSKKFGTDQTEWAISALPLGGYVKFLDVREPGLAPLSPEDLKREFCAQSVWKRIAIVAAGPVANFLLAIVLLSSLYVYGMPEIVTKIRVPSIDSIAYQSGLRNGDLVLKLDGKDIRSWSEMSSHLLQSGLSAQKVLMTVRRVDADSRSRELIVELPAIQLASKDAEGDLLNNFGFSVFGSIPVLQAVTPSGPADNAGLLAQDRILAIDNKELLDSRELSEIIGRSGGKSLQLSILRAGKKIELNVIPKNQDVDGKQIGRIGVDLLPPESVIVQESVPAALLKGAEATWDGSMLSLKMLGKMIAGQLSLKNISGPLTIAEYAGKTSSAGPISYLGFLAWISISLGVMNLLPIPVLDGGHLLYYSLELFTGKPVSERFSGIAQRIGIALLIMLMSIALFNDINRQWHNAESRQEQSHSPR